MWKRNSWNLGIIFFVLLFSLSFISAKNISIDYPSEVKVDEEFTVKIVLEDFPEDTYDVKIDITAENDRIGQIYDDSLEKYKSTYYFVNDIITVEKEFKLKIVTEYEGEADILVKIRETNDIFEGYVINIVLEEVEVIVEDEEIEDEEIEVVVDEDEEIEEEVIVNVEEEENILENLTNDNKDVVVLTPQSIKDPKNKEIVFKSKNEKIKEYAIYSFAMYCIILLTLLLIDRK